MYNIYGTFFPNVRHNMQKGSRRRSCGSRAGRFFVLFHFAGPPNAIEGVQELFAVQTADDLLRALGEQR